MQRDEVVTDVSVRFRACNMTNTQCGFAREIFHRYIGSYSSEFRSTLRALNTRPRGPSSGYTTARAFARSKKGESAMKHRIVYISYRFLCRESKYSTQFLMSLWISRVYMNLVRLYNGRFYERNRNNVCNINEKNFRDFRVKR